MTSGPIPSPGITASFTTDLTVSTGGGLDGVANGVLHIDGHIAVNSQHHRGTATGGVLTQLRRFDVHLAAPSRVPILPSAPGLSP